MVNCSEQLFGVGVVDIDTLLNHVKYCVVYFTYFLFGGCSIWLSNSQERRKIVYSNVLSLDICLIFQEECWTDRDLVIKFSREKGCFVVRYLPNFPKGMLEGQGPREC